MDVTDILRRLQSQAIAHPADIAVETPGGERITYGSFWDRIVRVSNGLMNEGMAPGDRVLFAVRPGVAAFVLILAIVRAGGVIVALDLGMGRDIFLKRMALVKPAWVVAESVVYALSANRLLRAFLKRRNIEIPAIAALSGCRFVRVGFRWPGVPPSLSLNKLLRSSLSDLEPPRPTPNDPVFMVFTSGTTEAPRVVVHSSRSIGATIGVIAEHARLTDRDVVYSEQLHLVLPALLAGATCVIPRPGRFSPRRMLAALNGYHVTCTTAIPAEFGQLIDHLRRTHQQMPDHLRMTLLGAAPVRREFLASVRDMVPPRSKIWCVYAATEMLPMCGIEMQDKLAYEGEGDLVGEPFPGITFASAADGELIASGPNLASGYLEEPPLIAFHTGDLGHIDAGDRVILLGRKKDMIIRGHHNIYPELLESVITGIEGVRECALIGVPNESDTDELVILVVEPDSNEPVLETENRDRLFRELREGPHAIDALALPDMIVFMPIPHGGRSQKVDKDRLREVLTEALCESQ